MQLRRFTIPECSTRRDVELSGSFPGRGARAMADRLDCAVRETGVSLDCLRVHRHLDIINVGGHGQHGRAYQKGDHQRHPPHRLLLGEFYRPVLLQDEPGT